ncbi:YraN family protein [Alicyclobacillus hesperidum]|uniref:YraN family protein n=1 Tax=Alicyclobacillus hesperidum TaxID=89784 RepID=UPI00031AC5BB|nr:YraN family protein [Alicyclobacillus hesperidum]
MFTDLKNSSNSIAIGKFGEKFVENYLIRCLGWEVIDRNLRSPYGEIDIVAKTGTTFVFVEVKTRRSDRFGAPLEALSNAQLIRLVHQAEGYAARLSRDIAQHVCLDVVGLRIHRNVVVDIQHVRIYPD